MSADKWSGLQRAAEARMMKLRELVQNLHECDPFDAPYLAGNLLEDAADAIEWLLEGQRIDK